MTPPLSANWRRSSYSNGMGGECVEVSLSSPCVAIRDSKASDSGRQVAISSYAWTHFVGQYARQS
ncbi:DUF397 domain-containing protein [Streptomyces sp. NPDC050400]|uniref:DUF397 domain-containing protein n=1 Tax=Streptomyces sp. NPDC050400 TaxID=3365610 RepID=UPI0037B1A4F4